MILEERIEKDRYFYPDQWAEEVSQGSPVGVFAPFRFQRYIMRRVADAVRRKHGRIIINAPTRHGKSIPLAKWMPIWFLDQFPQGHVIVSTYGQQLATEWGRAVRNEFQANRLLRTKLAQDSQAADVWHTTEGGYMVAAGIDGPILGKGYELAIIDDPHKDWNEAHSPVERQHVIDWFFQTFLSRRHPGSVIVIDQQRLHDEDLSGYLMERMPGVWEVYRFPAIAEEDDRIGRKKGDALAPEWFNVETLLEMKREMILGSSGDAGWEAMYQQNTTGYAPGRLYHKFHKPTHVDGSIVLRDDLPLQVDFDFNKNPGMHVEISQYDPKADLFVVRHEVFGPMMKLEPCLKAITRLLKDTYEKWRWPTLEIYGDASSKQERAETTHTQYQMVHSWAQNLPHDFGVQIPYVIRIPDNKKNPPVLDRILCMNNALMDGEGEYHMKIHPDCQRLLADLRDMREDEKGLEDKRDTELSHASSALGYCVYVVRKVVNPWKAAKAIDTKGRYASPVSKYLGVNPLPAAYAGSSVNVSGRYRTAF